MLYVEARAQGVCRFLSCARSQGEGNSKTSTRPTKAWLEIAAAVPHRSPKQARMKRSAAAQRSAKLGPCQPLPAPAWAQPILSPKRIRIPISRDNASHVTRPFGFFPTILFIFLHKVWAFGTRHFHPGNFKGRWTSDEDERLSSCAHYFLMRALLPLHAYARLHASLSERQTRVWWRIRFRQAQRSAEIEEKWIRRGAK